MKRLTFLLVMLSGGLVHGQVDVKITPMNRHYFNFNLAFPEAERDLATGEFQFNGMAALSATAFKNPATVPDATVGESESSRLKRLIPNNKTHLLQQSYLGGSFAGTNADMSFGDFFPKPAGVKIGDTTYEFDSQPILSIKQQWVDDDDKGHKVLDPNAPSKPPLKDNTFKCVTVENLDATPFDFEFASGYKERFYWSPHKNEVFASHSGLVEIWWKSSRKISESGGEDVYLVKKMTHSVSAASSKPTKKFYWTEGRFDGQPIRIPDGVVQEVRVAYNNQIPELVEVPFRPEGATFAANQPPLPHSTLWVEDLDNSIRSYNKEGRVLIEYLGETVSPGIRKHLGFEVVDVIRNRSPESLDLYLGERARPSDGTAAPNASGDKDRSPDNKLLKDVELYTAWMINPGQEEYVSYHKVNEKDAYYAIKKNQSQNEVRIWWFLPSTEGGLGIEWPSELNSYRIIWPDELKWYDLNVRPVDDSLTDMTYLKFPSEYSPLLKTQDAIGEADINEAQQLTVTLNPNSDNVNRSLILLNSGNDFWYMRVYSYMETNPAPDKLGDLQGQVDSAEEGSNERKEAVSNLARYTELKNYYVSETVVVGDRIKKPAGADSTAGYISHGTIYNPNAYKNPITSSWTEAEKGSIIPVNARDTEKTLRIWWYKRIDPPTNTDSFDPIYMPSIAGKYTVVWPSPNKIVTTTGTFTADSTTDSEADFVSDLVEGTSYTVKNLRTGESASVTDWDKNSLTIKYVVASGAFTADIAIDNAADFSNLVVGTSYTVKNLRTGKSASVTEWDNNTKSLTTILNVTSGDQYEITSDFPVTLGDRYEITSDFPVTSGDQYEITSTLPVTSGNRYEITSVSDVAEIVLAQRIGTGDLPLSQQGATLYVENDPTAIGYNPNEEHAVSIRGRFYAIRDDLNIYERRSVVASGTFTADRVMDNAADFQTLLTDGTSYKVENTTTGNSASVTNWGKTNLVTRMVVRLGTFTGALNKDSTVNFNSLLTNGTAYWVTNLRTGQTVNVGGWSEDRLAVGGFSQKGDPYEITSTLPVTKDNEYEITYVPDASSSEGVRSSKPYVLIQYVDPADERMSMRAFRVLREKDVNNDGDLNDPEDHTFRYEQRAGTALSPPMPLADMPLPIEDGILKNTELTRDTVDPPDGGDLQTGNPKSGHADLSHYNKFTFTDRTDKMWIYRGPHEPNKDWSEDPAIEMQFYYIVQEGFAFPNNVGGGKIVVTASTNDKGTIVPYLRDYKDPGDPSSGFDDTRNPPKTGTPLTIRYVPFWPDDPRLPAGPHKLKDPKFSELNFAQTLTLPTNNLPQIRGQSSAEILYQQSIAENVSPTKQKKSVVLHDPERRKIYAMAKKDGDDTLLKEVPSSALTVNSRGKTFFQNLAPHLVDRFFFDPSLGQNGALVLEGIFTEEKSIDNYFLLNVLPPSEVTILKKLVLVGDTKKSAWDNAIDSLKTEMDTFTLDSDTNEYKIVTVPDSDDDPLNDEKTHSRNIGVTELAEVVHSNTAVVSYALTAVGGGKGYVTMLFGNGDNPDFVDNPTVVQIFKVGGGLYQGHVKPLVPENPLAEKVTLQHTGDFAGKTNEFEFEWKYAPPVNGGPPDPNDTDITWFEFKGKDVKDTLKNRIVFGEGASPILILTDNYVSMRYRPLPAQSRETHHAGFDDDGTGQSHWSDWTKPALVEGWIKRVLAGINPFNQRLGDFFNNAVDTNISLLTQAGTKWEGDIALTLDNMNDVGLIEIYETVLNRGKSFSIDAGEDHPGANDALLLATGYLADLYQIVGDEAFADAANPMVLFDTQSIPLVADSSVSQGFSEFFRETATSRFAFEGQLSSLLEEETILLRGRLGAIIDPVTGKRKVRSPGVEYRPYYNRLPWNYTRGIDAGEVVYALNYNIRERQETESDGVIDAADAARQYPMGHGDAYGHYLMVLKNYYRLLTHPKFSWAPRIEAVNVLGVPVAVDYFDERKFAKAAVSLGRTAKQVIGLERRKTYQEDKSQGWGHLRDETKAAGKRIDPAWGVDGWASRSAQGGYFHWIVSNALLPEKDTVNEGIQKIDRTTVPELDELALQASEFQSHADEANLFVNPLGLKENSILFDISPAELAQGQVHYEQIYERAASSLNNAWEIFDRARESTQLLRALENQSEDFSTAVFDEERSFTSQLKAIYGTPYPKEIGPGKTYPQGYEGPDIERYYWIDKPYHFEDPSDEDIAEFNFTTLGEGQYLTFDPDFAGLSLDFIPGTPISHKYKVQPNSIAQFAEKSWGRRKVTGELQQALLEMVVARTKLKAVADDNLRLHKDFERQLEIFDDAVKAHENSGLEFDNARTDIRATEASIASLRSYAVWAKAASKIGGWWAMTTGEAMPQVLGLATDPSFSARGLALIAGGTTMTASEWENARLTQAAEGKVPDIREKLLKLEKDLANLGFGTERKTMVWKLKQAFDAAHLYATEVDLAISELTKASQRYYTLEAKGMSLQTNREIFRKRASAIAQGYRTRDVGFRTFRTEALEQYQGLMDWAARYAYSAAKAYDYETGLLGDDAGQDFLNRIVRTRSLGLVSENGKPQFAGADTGDPGLSGLLRKLDGDWSVVKGRLGFNNPDSNGTTFSLRTENYRLTESKTYTKNANGETTITDGDHRGWKSQLEKSFVPDLRTDAHVAAHALQIEGSEEPVPGIILEFSTQIMEGKNFFGNKLMKGDHVFSPTAFATKIRSVGVVLEGYKGMDVCLPCTFNGAGDVTSDDVNALSATPYLYLIPIGQDKMRTPPLGDGTDLRSWTVHDHALPLPYNIGNSTFSDTTDWTGAESLSEPFFKPRKHQAFRAVNHEEFFTLDHSEDFTNSRLVGRSVWNTKWKLVIPGRALLADPIEGLDRFMRTVTDVQLYLKTYSHSGN